MSREARRKALSYGVLAGERALDGLAWESAAGLAAELISFARTDDHVDPGVTADLLRIRGTALFRLGRRAEAMEPLARAGGLYRQSGNADGMGKLVAVPVFFQVGDFEMRDLAYDAASLLPADHPQAFNARFAAAFAGYQVDGDYREGLRRTESLRNVPQNGNPTERQIITHGLRRYLLIKLRRLSEAQAEIRRVPPTPVHSSPRLEALRLVPHVALAARFGHAEEAELSARMMVDAVRKTDDFSYMGRFYAFLLRSLLRRGAWDEIEATAAEAREATPDEPVGYHAAIVARYYRGEADSGDALWRELESMSHEMDPVRGQTHAAVITSAAQRAYVFEEPPRDSEAETLARALLEMQSGHPLIRARAGVALSELLFIRWLCEEEPDPRDPALAEGGLAENDRVWLLQDHCAHFAWGLLRAVQGKSRAAERARLTRHGVVPGRKQQAQRLETEAAQLAGDYGLAPLSRRLRRGSLLSPRERTVLVAAAQGKPDKQIAAELALSRYTVGNHMRHILKKLGSGSRTEAVNRARKLGLIRD